MDHTMHHQSSLNRLAVSATIHCLTGCSIGEVLGMVIGTALGWSNWETVALSVTLAFVFGYALTLLPLLRAGLAVGTALSLAFASDTLSITVMEIVDNAIMLVIPGAMDAGLAEPLFWGSLLSALVLAGVAAFPINRWLIARGRGHALVHQHHGHHSSHKSEHAGSKHPHHTTTILSIVGILFSVSFAHAQHKNPAAKIEVVSQSPWGAGDEIGTLNMMTDASRAAILARIAGGKAYDLSVEYFVGMPSWHLFGDPRYQYWLTHTPRGTSVDDPANVGAELNAKVAYTGDAVSMYTHTGTHIDALNHFGLNGAVWNGFKADEHLGDRGWRKTGVEKFPPIIARGVLIDIAALKGVTKLPDSYQITAQDLKDALTRQQTRLQPGDAVLIRGGRMTAWPDDAKYVHHQPGLSLGGARWLAEEQRAMVIGGDNLSLEHFPVEGKDNWIPVHTYLLAQRGVPIIEVINLDELARDRVYEFAFIAASLKFRGASAAPFRPLALPVR